MEQIIETINWNVVNVNDMQFGFMPGHEATDVIFILRQIQ